VKGFERPSLIEALSEEIGQYLLYRGFLAFEQTAKPLYLAVPSDAYNGILSEWIGQYLVHEYKILLLVFDSVEEEIVKWIT
jgi:hypothetical protein